jgi:hypothetical protein
MHGWSDVVDQKAVAANVALSSGARMRCHMSGMAASAVSNVISTLPAELSWLLHRNSRGA